MRYNVLKEKGGKEIKVRKDKGKKIMDEDKKIEISTCISTCFPSILKDYTTGTRNIFDKITPAEIQSKQLLATDSVIHSMRLSLQLSECVINYH
jgi:hypothetical protein